MVDPVPVQQSEVKCDRCGGPNPIAWHAPSPLWNAVMRNEQPEVGFCCPTCFVLVAQERGIDGEWHFTVHGDVAALFPDPHSRTWDETRCLWVEPVAPSQSVEEARKNVYRAGRAAVALEGPAEAFEIAVDALIEAVRREQDGLALVAAARELANQAEIVTKCRCEEAWTSRRMHESNSWCGYLDEEIAAVRAALGEQDGDHQVG